MQDSKYCYPNSDVLINKLNIINAYKLYKTEKKDTFIKLYMLQTNPIKGSFDFSHLKAIHKYIFNDLYDWAGQVRTVDINKGFWFCPTENIQSYADTIFSKYYPQCYAVKNNRDDFIKILAENYGELNALHPFREGNGRAQREFARLVCMECGYDFDLSCTYHQNMLNASIISLERGDNSEFVKIFNEAVTPIGGKQILKNSLKILAADDLTLEPDDSYHYNSCDDHEEAAIYNRLYKARIDKMAAQKAINDAENLLRQKSQHKYTEKELEETLADQNAFDNRNFSSEIKDEADKSQNNNELVP